MKLKIILYEIILLIFISCTQKQTGQNNYVAKVRVKLTKIEKGALPDYIEMTGKIVYLNKTNLVAPISGYITRVKVKVGDIVKKGELLFEIQSPEAYAIKKDTAFNYGTVKIFANANGRISNLNVVGTDVYIQRANLLASLIASNDSKIQADVPFEYMKWIKIGNSCKIILPDKTELNGKFYKILPQANEQEQTVKILVNIHTARFLPENLFVRVLVDKGSRHQVQILPQSCLQTNALMTKFWVMKLINDSTAVRIPVTVGNQTHKKVEILSPVFQDTDLIISQGAYGLNDTAFIKVIK
jgi:multidrug efflux pump subunit AcrA (membrane-fusion protein)